MNEIRLFAWELDSMPIYSTTNPSGTTPFKMWRRNRNVYGVDPVQRRDIEPEWIVCQYLEPVKIREGRRFVWVSPIRTFRVVLRSGPAPRLYSPPDWSNYARWQSQHRFFREDV